MPIDAPLPPVTSPRGLTTEDATPGRTSAGIQSAEIALSVFSAMAHTSGAYAVSELGRQLDVPRTKAHRYLMSLEYMSFVEQDPASARHRLGTQALWVGLSALSDADFVRESSNLLPKLAERLNESVFPSV